jgi:Ni/Co efflux regulator RcnB
MSFGAALFRLLFGEKQARTVPASEEKHDNGDQHRNHSPAAHTVTVRTCHPPRQLRAASGTTCTRSNTPDHHRFVPGHATSGSKRDAQATCS